MTAEEYVVQNLQKAEENIQELEAANRYLMEVVECKNDFIEAIVRRIEKNDNCGWFDIRTVFKRDPDYNMFETLYNMKPEDDEEEYEDD